MLAYATFVERGSPSLAEHTVEYIRDKQTACGQFFDTHFVVNLAKRSAADWQSNMELMLHELSQTVVRSNDHLVHEFYQKRHVRDSAAIWVASVDGRMDRDWSQSAPSLCENLWAGSNHLAVPPTSTPKLVNPCSEMDGRSSGL
jgi:hypothetical protein